MQTGDTTPQKQSLARKVMEHLIGVMCGTAILALILFFFYMAFTSSREWLDHSVLDGLRGASQAEVTRALGQPSATYDGQGMDGNFYYRWYYRHSWKSPQYRLVFDADGRMIKWVFEDYD